MPVWVGRVWVVPAAFLVAFLVVPLLALAQRTWSSTALLRLLDGQTWQIAALATVQALVSTALALAVGLPIANVVSRYRFPGRALTQALATVPFVLPTVVVALAMRSLLGASLGQGFAVVVLAHAYVNLAVVVRIVGARWAQHDARYEATARTLGASPWRAFTTVTLPMLRGSILSAAAVVFVFCFTSLGIVLILGDSSTRTLESRILRQASLLLDFPGAAATAVVQLLVVSAVLGLGAYAARTAPAERLQPASLRRLPRSRKGRVAVIGTAIATIAIVLVPIAALLRAAFVDNGSLTLAFWRAMSTIDAGTTRIGSPLDAVGTSLAYALLTAAIAGLVGGMAAIAALAPRVGWVVGAIAIAPLGISAATLGLGTVLAYGRPPIDVRATGMLVPLAHALVAVPLVVAVAAPALRAADSRLVLVAQTLGATRSRAFWTAYGPILRVVMIAAAGLAGAVSLGEFGAASFLARADNPTVPLLIVRLLARPGALSYGVAAGLAVVLVALTLLLVLAVDRLGRTARVELAAT